MVAEALLASGYGAIWTTTVAERAVALHGELHVLADTGDSNLVAKQRRRIQEARADDTNFLRMRNIKPPNPSRSSMRLASRAALHHRFVPKP
ncbi:hypothetical protein ACVWXO_003290 [Bradyrhizobium sp. LM2.7]